jgi:hypothetical protein
MDPTKEQDKCLCKCSGKKTVHRKFKITETEKGETGEEQSQQHVYHILWHRGDCSQRIRPGRPNREFCCCTYKKKIVRIEGDTLVVRYFNSVLFNKHYNTAI